MKSTFLMLILVIELLHFTLVTSIRLAFFNETDLAGRYTVGITTPTPAPWPKTVSCDFDDFYFCGWKQIWNGDDDFDWKLGQGKQSFSKNRRRGGRTGVKDDRSGGGGYIYIKSGRWSNRTAKIRTGTLHQPQDGCIKFWYHMRGRHMGHLKLYEKDFNYSSSARFDESSSSYRLRWEMYGSQGVEWQQGVVLIKRPMPPQFRKVLMFEAFDWDKGPSGNIVLDDITFDPLTNPEDCLFYPPEAAPPVAETTTILSSAAPPTAIVTTRSPNTTTMSRTIASTSPTNTTTSPTNTMKPYISTSTSSRSFLQQSSVSSRKTKFIPNNTTQQINTLVMKGSTAVQESLSLTEQGKLRERDGNVSITIPGAGTSAKHSKNVSVVGAAVGIVIGILVLVGAGLCLLKNQKRRRYNYYDNSTVHMTRMSPDVVDPLDTSMVYRKLT